MPLLATVATAQRTAAKRASAEGPAAAEGARALLRCAVTAQAETPGREHSVALPPLVAA